jgi:O-antigen/teichoic acid export membrane protein
MLLIAATIGGAAHSVLTVFGSGFSSATQALALLVLFPALASITITQTQALWALNRPGQTSIIAAARLVVTILLLVLLTPSIGVVGPALALLAGYVVAAVLSGLALRPSLASPLRTTWPRRERLAIVVAYAAGFVAAHAVEQVIPTTAGLLLALPAGIVAYILLFALCGGTNSRDLRRLNELRQWYQARRTTKVRSNHEQKEPVEPRAGCLPADNVAATEL